MLVALSIIALGVAVALLARQVRHERAEVDALGEWLQAIERRIAAHREDYTGTANSVRMHGAQLKGAGERIRSIEAELVAVQRTVDGLLQRGIPIDDSDVRRLRAEILGGSLPGDGLPVEGALSELRQQVEGINTRVMSELGRLANMDRVSLRVIAEGAARRELRNELAQRRSLWDRLVGWLRRPVGS